MRGFDLAEVESLNFIIALMYSEKMPEACHRTLLVGHHFHNYSHDVRHILPGQPEPESHPPS